MSKSKILEGKKVLIVDDEPDILSVLEELLTMCRVAKAGTFEEGRRLLEEDTFDIVILDIMGVEGYRLLEIAKRRDIPALMLTAHALTPENVVRSIKEGADSYVPKDEIGNITAFLIDVLEARKKGINPWKPWQDRLPSSYFERKWGAAWKDTDKEFWNTFRESLKARKEKAG